MAKGNQEPGTAPPAASHAPPFANGILDDLLTDFILRDGLQKLGDWGILTKGHVQLLVDDQINSDVCISPLILEEGFGAVRMIISNQVGVTENHLVETNISIVKIQMLSMFAFERSFLAVLCLVSNFALIRFHFFTIVF